MKARYRTTLRPASFGGLPQGVVYRFFEAPLDLDLPGIARSRHRYGVVETDRELTVAELKHFDIVRICPNSGCGGDLLPVAWTKNVFGCATCHETWHQLPPDEAAWQRPKPPDKGGRGSHFRLHKHGETR